MLNKYLLKFDAKEILHYIKTGLFRDTTAGVIVGILALPLAIAFAIASGVSPEKGLITAIIGGFIISAFGGSKVQIGGPTGAFVVIVFGVVEKYGLDGLMIATILAGIFLIIMGIARVGTAIRFVPYPLTIGFTAGIAVIIFSSQIRDMFGLQMQTVPSEFIEKWISYIHHIHSFNLYSMGLTAGSILVIIIWPKINSKIPGPLIALVAGTIISTYFQFPVDTIGTRFGAIPSTIPLPSIPHFDFEVAKNLFTPALSIALLGGIEALLSAVVADGMIGSRHDSNKELIAQGAANIVSPLFGGIPATGAIARTATNIKNGGRTPVAGIIHAITLLLIVLFFGKWASYIPLACLAAILAVVSYNMSEWRSFLSIFKSPRTDIIVLLTTFLLTVVVDLTIAIQIGMIISVFFFMRQMSLVTNISSITREFKEDHNADDDPLAISKREVPEGVEVYEINGPFFFGAASKFSDAMMEIREQIPSVLILRMRFVPAIDSTGLHTLEDFYEKSKKKGTLLIISGIHTQALFALTQSGLLKKIGENNVFGNIDDALNRARNHLGLPEIKAPVTFKS